MTRRKALLFYQMIQRYKFHKVPGRKEEKNETVAVTISFYLCRDLIDLIVSVAADPTLRRLLAVRRGLEPLTPCVTGTYSNQLN